MTGSSFINLRHVKRMALPCVVAASLIAPPAALASGPRPAGDVTGQARVYEMPDLASVTAPYCCDYTVESWVPIAGTLRYGRTAQVYSRTTEAEEAPPLQAPATADRGFDVSDAALGGGVSGIAALALAAAAYALGRRRRFSALRS